MLISPVDLHSPFFSNIPKCECDRPLAIILSKVRSYLFYFSQLDFNNQSHAAREINDWVNNESRGLIPRFFRSPDELPRDSRVVMFNIFTFKGKISFTGLKECRPMTEGSWRVTSGLYRQQIKAPRRPMSTILLGLLSDFWERHRRE